MTELGEYERVRLMIEFPDPPLVYGGDYTRILASALTEIDGVHHLGEPTGWRPYPDSQRSGPFTGLVYGGSGTDVTIQLFEAGVEVEHLPDGVWGERGLPWLWAKDRDNHDADHMVYWQGEPFTGTVFGTDANDYYVTSINEWVDGQPIASATFDLDGKVTAIETGKRTTADGRTWSNDIRWEDGTVVWARSGLWTEFSDTSHMLCELAIHFNHRREVDRLSFRGPYLDIVSCSDWEDAWVISSPGDFRGMQAAAEFRVDNLGATPDSSGDRWVHSVIEAMAADGGIDNVETLTITRSGFTPQQIIELLGLGWPSLEKLEIGRGGLGPIAYFGSYFRVAAQLKQERPELRIFLSRIWVAAEDEHVSSGRDPYPTIIRLDPTLSHVVSMDNPNRQLSYHDLSSLELLDWLVAQPELKTVRLCDPTSFYAKGEEYNACLELISRTRPDVQLVIE